MAKYHMNKAEREIKDHEQMIAVLKGGRYAIIAMCRDNEPYVVTLSYGYDRSRNALYFHSAIKGLKIEFIAANPGVCATVIEDGGYLANRCAHQYRSVVLRGKMCRVDDPAERLHGLETIAGQLEADLQARKEKISRLSQELWQRTAILRLDIEEMTGKSGQ